MLKEQFHKKELTGALDTEQCLTLCYSEKSLSDMTAKSNIYNFNIFLVFSPVDKILAPIPI